MLAKITFISLIRFNGITYGRLPAVICTVIIGINARKAHELGVQAAY